MSNATGTWNKESFPYDTDYCDHFETPQRAFDDIAPLLDVLVMSTKISKRDDVTVYDPYYCDGRSGRLLRELGFQVKHEKRDFYADIKDGNVPHHDILVTNPPFSDRHKKKCLQYCFEQLRGPAKRPFAILMPNYVAAREYYKKFLLHQQQNTATEDAVYFIPSKTYHYDHPDGTGKDKPPFESLWFIGVNNKDTDREWRKEWPGGRIVESLDALSKSNAAFQLIFQKRPNPKQRKKKNKKRFIESGKADLQVTETKQSASLQPKKKSKYRDESGKRKQGRF